MTFWNAAHWDNGSKASPFTRSLPPSDERERRGGRWGDDLDNPPRGRLRDGIDVGDSERPVQGHDAS